MRITDEAVEAAVHAHGRASNPKWDHPIFGYETFHEDQKRFLRSQAREALEAAGYYIAGAWRQGADTALNYAYLNEDGITLDLFKPNPYD